MNEWKPTPDAEAELKKEVEYYPHDYLANYMLGFLASGERQYDESNKYLLAASKINPSAPEPFLYMGLNAFSEEKMDRAEEMLRKAVELTGSDEARSNYQIRRAYVDLARILARAGARKESDVFAAKARELQNKTMVESQQSVSAIMLAGGTGAAAAVMPLSRQQENQAAPSGTERRRPVRVTAKCQPNSAPQQKRARRRFGRCWRWRSTTSPHRRQFEGHILWPSATISRQSSGTALFPVWRRTSVSAPSGQRTIRKQSTASRWH